MIFVSAETKQRVTRILDLVNGAVEQNAMRVHTSILNEIVFILFNQAFLRIDYHQHRITAVNSPQRTDDTVALRDKGKRLKIYYVTQSGVKPPTFVFFVNEPELMHFSYERFLENKIRENFGFEVKYG